MRMLWTIGPASAPPSVVMAPKSANDLPLEGIDKVLVTGASGFVGRHLVGCLNEMGKRVVPISRAHGFDVTRDNLPLDGVGHVFHLAARTGIIEAWRSPLDYLSTNTFGTARILEQCRNHCSVTFISSYVYGNPESVPTRENNPLDVHNPYALSKALAEQICTFYAKFFNVAVVALRLFNIYGPGQDKTFLIPFILGQLLDPQQEEVQVKDLAPSRDYLYVSDAVEGIISASRAPAGFVFNVGSGIAYSVREIIEQARIATGIYKPYRSSEQKRSHEIEMTCANISAFQNAVNWTPKVSIDKGLRMIVDNMRG
jgi:nucleoside-diphosphate-sugar epimerase